MLKEGDAEVKMWGTSLAIRIPKEMVEQLGLEKDSEVELDVDGYELKIKKREKTLTELLSQITPENQHDEVDWGKPAGKEISQT